MDNVTVKDVVLDKKIEGYSFDRDNFLASGELTVTITLGEYRKLVENVATAQTRISKADEDKWKRNSENEALKKENAMLKEELLKYKLPPLGMCDKEGDSCNEESN